MQQRNKLQTDMIWLKIVDTPQVKNFIIDLNTEEQLYLQGIDSTGRSLADIGGPYSPVTVEIKRAKGGKASRVENITLYDTGEYYDSHEVEVDRNSFEINSDPQKDETNLFDEWGEDIVGLTEESLQKVISFLLEKYVTYTREIIFGTN